MKRLSAIACLLLAALTVRPSVAEERTISREDLLDKITGFWVGQLVGNYMGFPFENVYVDKPIPFLVDRYYTFRDDPAIHMNRDDHRSYLPVLVTMFEGAYSDDDTDIEFVTLHAVEKHGLDLNYAEVTEMWKKHINRKIWVANRTARTLMDQGMVAPETGSRQNNRNWFQIDPQLVNEIWSAFYPGMTERAADRAQWGARITNDDWGTHATVAYAVMYSGAFFEKDVERLVSMAVEVVPDEGPFAEGLGDVIRWHKQHPDWRDTRKKIHDKYYRYKAGSYEAPVSLVSSLQNGLCGIMAVLYGDGDFTKTVGIAVSAGYDCDNQAATCGGLVGVVNGAECVPDRLTKECQFRKRTWDKPFNDTYINFTRDDLPIANRISDIVRRTAAIAEEAIVRGGGRKVEENGRVEYVVNCSF